MSNLNSETCIFSGGASHSGYHAISGACEVG